MEQEKMNMGDFENELNASFRVIREDDLLKGTIIDVSEDGLTIDLNYYTEGFVPADEVSNDPHFSIRSMCVGDEITAVVTNRDSENGNIILSLKQAADLTAWDALRELLDTKTIVKVRVDRAVNGGVVAYVKDIRGFIPASQLSLKYVENVEDYVGKELSVIVITVDEKKKKLILSAKEVERELEEQARDQQVSQLQKGIVTKGIVEKIVPYGAFVSIGNGLSGLLHISQICNKRIKSPNEVLKLNDEVTVKVIDIKDGKISLSITAVEENSDDVIEDISEVPFSYSTGDDATTNLMSLLKNIKL